MEDHSAATLDQVPDHHRKRHVFTDEAGAVIEPPVAGHNAGAASGHEAWPDQEGGWYVQNRRLGESGFGWYKDTADGPAYTGHLTSSYEHNIEPGPDGRYHWATERHWLGGSVFRARYRESGYRGHGVNRRWTDRNRWAWFVTSFDYNEPAPLWFMAQLPAGATPATVADAIGALKPAAVRAAEAAGVPVLRQGDVFVIASRMTAPGDAGERALIRAGGELVPQARDGWRHVNDSHAATRVVRMPGGALYARGIMRHRPPMRRPDHVNRELWDRRAWGLIVINTVPSRRSWSLGGDVD